MPSFFLVIFLNSNFHISNIKNISEIKKWRINNMGHLEEKHTAKQKAELAERMMFERQIQVCSSFYKYMKE